LNRTFRHKTKKFKTKTVTEKNYRKFHAEKKSLHRAEKKSVTVNTVCPHCGKTIAIVIK